MSVSERTEQWSRAVEASPRGRVAVFVAEHGGDMIGFAAGGRQRDQGLLAQGFTGEIFAVYVLQRAQRRGVGRRLVTAVGQTLRGDGHQAASLWVLRENRRARDFYRRLGGAVAGEKVDDRGTVTLVELAYGWREIAAIAGPQA